METTAELTADFIDLDFAKVSYLFVVGFIGGLVSGFIGSGGAFVLTPAMMSIGVPAIVAVASNMCHKFPKAMVGAIKRAKYGQVDVKLGIVIGISAEAGVLYGAHLQHAIKRAFGDAGSNLYVSVAFVIVLAVVGGYVLWDAVKIYKSGRADGEETISGIARRLQSIHIPYTMVYFKSLKAKVSVLFTIPLGFATGMLAATIAVGGFIGVPGMHYVLGAPSLMASATELLVAFVMGVGGTVKYAWSGLVDIRLAMIILAGSLFGIQLGAIGTTYVKPHMIKIVMGVIMMLVLVSRGLVIPVYLSELTIIRELETSTAKVLTGTSFALLVLGLASGAFIVFSALWRGLRAQRREEVLAAVPSAPFAHAVAAPTRPQLSPIGRFERFLVATDGSEFSAGAIRQTFRMAQKCGGRIHAVSVIGDAEYESMGEQLLKKELDTMRAHLDDVKTQAAVAAIACETRVIQGRKIHEEIVDEAERVQADLIIMGRRGRRGLARLMVGDATSRVIGRASCSVLVVPRAAELTGGHFVLATDGSRSADAAAVAAANLAKYCRTPVTVLSVTMPSHGEARREEARHAVRRAVAFLRKEGVAAEGTVPEGRPDEMIVRMALNKDADLIVMGSHGRTGLERVLLGSTAERVINDTGCAVLVAKAG